MHMPPVLSLTSLRKQISRMLPPRLQTIPICPSGISTSWNARSLLPGRKLYFCIFTFGKVFLDHVYRPGGAVHWKCPGALETRSNNFFDFHFNTKLNHALVR